MPLDGSTIQVMHRICHPFTTRRRKAMCCLSWRSKVGELNQTARSLILNYKQFKGFLTLKRMTDFTLQRMCDILNARKMSAGSCVLMTE